MKLDDGARYMGPFVSSFTVQEAVDEACRVFQLPHLQSNLCEGKRSAPASTIISSSVAPLYRPGEGERLQRASESGAGVPDAGQRADAENPCAPGWRKPPKIWNLRRRRGCETNIHAIERLGQKQKVVMSRIQEQDVIALAQGVEDICFEVFSFRGGRLADREDFLVDSIDGTPDCRRRGRNSSAGIIRCGSMCLLRLRWTARSRTASFWNAG